MDFARCSLACSCSTQLRELGRQGRGGHLGGLLDDADRQSLSGLIGELLDPDRGSQAGGTAQETRDADAEKRTCEKKKSNRLQYRLQYRLQRPAFLRVRSILGRSSCALMTKERFNG